MLQQPALLDEIQQGELAESRQQIVKAKEDYKQALALHPGDSQLREKYAWFLYSNGFHDKECLRLLEVTLREGHASDPSGIFNAIVEVRDELGLPSSPLRPPALSGKQTSAQSPRARIARKRKSAAAGFQTAQSGKESIKPEIGEQETFRHWIAIPTYSYSVFNEGRQSWQEEDLQLFYRFNKRLILGGEVDVMQRPPSGTDTYYSAMASYYLWKWLEIHGKISVCPDPTFAASQIYAGGVIYQAMPRLGLLLDYQRYEFNAGPIDQLNPGIAYNFTDETSVVLRYVRGWAFYTLQYNYYSAMMNLGLPGKRRLSFGFAYGTDPDNEAGAGGVNVNTLSPAYNYYLYFTQPITRDLSLIVGGTYTYRLNQQGGQLYQQLTPTIGCSWKF
jgi:hypothetical protein